MKQASSPLILRTVFGMGLLALTVWLLPSQTELWRRVFISILSVTLGFHLATALTVTSEKGKLWLECLAFPMMILGFLILPTPMGWVLFLSGMFWRALVGRVL